MAKILKFSKKKLKEINDFLEVRYIELEKIRTPLDKEILEDVEIANDYDKNMQDWNPTTKTGKRWYQIKQTVPYIYTITQTMVARLIQTFFGKQNYLKIYVEEKPYKGIEKELQRWVQYELDRIKFKGRARDFLEEALSQRTTWLELRPEINGSTKEMTKVDFNVYQWFDVWFDTKAIEVEDTDFFLKNIMPLWKLQENSKNYINLDQIKGTIPSDEDVKKRQVYSIKNSRDKSITYYDTIKNNVTDEVIVYKWEGYYDIGKDPEKPDFKPVIFHWANRKVIIRTEQIDYETDRKILIFPVRPIRQANTLVGKSVPQLTKHLQYLLNEAFALTIQNFKLLVNLLFKYKKDADIDFTELFAAEGNAIGYGDDPNDISLFEIKNLVDVGLAIISWVIQFMQQVTGAVDYLMGTSAARGTTETASGIKTITEQAMFKFQMMAENVYGDMKEFINYLVILWAQYGKDTVLKKYPGLTEFFNLSIETLEDSQIIDIGLNDLTLRRDVERTAFLNGINIIAGLLEKVGGNIPALLRDVMEKLEVEHIDDILKGAKTPKEIMEQLTAQTLAAQSAENQKKGGSTKTNPSAGNAAGPEEEANNTTPNAPEVT